MPFIFQFSGLEAYFGGYAHQSIRGEGKVPASSPGIMPIALITHFWLQVGQKFCVFLLALAGCIFTVMAQGIQLMAKGTQRKCFGFE